MRRTCSSGRSGAPALPAAPALVAVHLSSLAERGLAPPSIGRALAAIAHTHKRAGLTAPHRADGGQVIAEVLAGIRRSRPTGPQGPRRRRISFCSAPLDRR